jgi:hypothetical protein
LPSKGEKSKALVFVLKKRSLLKVGVLGFCIMLYPIPLLTTNYPSIYASITKIIRPYHIFNSYGLFAVMTISRSEIIIRGSDDRENWFPYEFKWNPVMWRKNRDLLLRTNLD